MTDIDDRLAELDAEEAGNKAAASANEFITDDGDMDIESIAAGFDDLDDDGKAGDAAAAKAPEAAQTAESLAQAPHQAKFVRFLPALAEEDRVKQTRQAPGYLDSFLANDESVLTFGHDILQRINDRRARILDQQKDISMPEVDKLLSKANSDMDGFFRKYDEKQVLEMNKRYAKWKIWRHSAKKASEKWKFDQLTMREKFDEIKAKIVEHKSRLRISRQLIAQTMVDNRRDIESFTKVMGALEAVDDLATKRSDDIRARMAGLQQTDPEWGRLNSQLEKLANVINLIERQHAEYLTVLTMAWAANSQSSNILKTTGDTMHRLTMVTDLTIPTMEQIVSNLGFLTMAGDANKAITAIDESARHMLQLYNNTAKSQMPMMEKIAQGQTFTAQDIRDTAQAVKETNEGIVNAIRNARQQRIDTEREALLAIKDIRDSDTERSKNLVEALVGMGAPSAARPASARDAVASMPAPIAATGREEDEQTAPDAPAKDATAKAE